MAQLLAARDRAGRYRGLAMSSRDRGERDVYERIVDLYVNLAEELEKVLELRGALRQFRSIAIAMGMESRPFRFQCFRSIPIVAKAAHWRAGSECLANGGGRQYQDAAAVAVVPREPHATPGAERSRASPSALGTPPTSYF
jgi:hypothetical protein